MEEVKVKIVGIAPLLMNRFKMDKPDEKEEKGMTKLIILLVLAIFLGGCAASGGYWTKPDYSWDQYQKDKNECRAIDPDHYSAGMMQFILLSGAIDPDVESSDAYQYCMKMRGYEWVEIKKKGHEEKSGN